MSHITAEDLKGHLDHSVPMARSKLQLSFAFLFFGLLGTLAAGCERPPEPPRARSMAAVLAEKMPVLRAPQQNRSDDQRRFRDAPVYIDGRRVGVIRPLEVPPSIKPRMRVRPGLPPAPRYSIAEYIAAAGGDLAKVREVHFYGGRNRISIVPGDELRNHREDLLFLFTAGARGKPRVGWPTTEVKTNTRLDLLQAVVVYQAKDPPILDEKTGVLHFGDNKPIDGIPYAPAEELKGTRFYGDGVLLGWMKRKVLPNSILLPGADVASGLFSLSAYVASLGVDPAKVKAIELVQDDDAVARLDGKAVSADHSLAFKLPRRNQGNLVLLVPKSSFPKAPDNLPDPVPIRISAVQLFLKQAPPSRTYASVEDLVDRGDDPGSNRKGGSGNDQGDSEN